SLSTYYRAGRPGVRPFLPCQPPGGEAMERFQFTNRRTFLFRLGCWAATAALLNGPLGCMHQQTRLQSADESERDRYEIKTVGDITTTGNADNVALAGVALVVGLDGTGGDSPPDAYRAMLEDALKKQGVKNVKEVLASSDNALVVVSASIPP